MAVKIMLIVFCAISVSVNLLFCGASAYRKNAMSIKETKKAARIARIARKRRNRKMVKGTWKEVTFQTEG